MVSIKDQKKLITKQKKLLNKIADCQRTGKPLGLDEDEVKTIERALCCHRAVIILDLEKRKAEKDGVDIV